MNVFRTLSLVAIFAIMAPAAFAGRTVHDASIVVSGTIEDDNEIVIDVNGTNNVAVDLTNGSTDLKIASFRLHSNNLNGYKVQVKSTNGGQMVQPSVTTTIPFSVKFGSFNYVTPTTTFADLGSTGQLQRKTTLSGDILVNSVATPNLPAGTYSDEVFFRVVAL